MQAEQTSSPGSVGPAPFLYMGILLFILGLVAFCGAPGMGNAATPERALEKRLAVEQKKAATRRQGLERLTEEERRLNADLAEAEKRIFALENEIARQQKALQELGIADSAIKKEQAALLAEQARAEEAMAETLRLLWDITSRRLALGNRDMMDWVEIDREYAWSTELFGAFEEYRKELAAREIQLTQVLSKQNKISQDIEKSLDAIDAEKGNLLKSRMIYARQMSELRKKRTDTEAELRGILKLVESLNFEISTRPSRPGNMSAMKGKLPWPVIDGKLRVRYAPKAQPASRGLGFAAPDKSEVCAVANGKVVHNDVLRGFGTVLIVQHEENYYSLYAFLGSSPLRVGQNVEIRQKIGSVGYYPAIKGSGLYFELRFKQKAINPEQWFAL